MADERRSKEDLNRELIELLNELRVVLPGVQVLFGFLLAVPFANGWRRVTSLQKDVFFVAFLCAAVSTVLLIAPSVVHRIEWRSHDKEHILELGNRLAIAGTAFLALSMFAAVFLITDLLFKATYACVATALVVAGCAWFWYGLPLRRRARRLRAGS